VITKTTYALTATPAAFDMPSCVLNVRDRHDAAGATQRPMGFHSWNRPDDQSGSLTD
jgi:hypothetical protein